MIRMKLWIRNTNSGFTIIELVIVIAIAVVIAGLLLGTFVQYARYQNYQQSVSEIALAVSQVQAAARVATLDQDHGVAFTANSIVQFTGSNYDAFDTTNVSRTFTNVQIIPSLTDGASELRLQKVTGFPNATGTVLVVGTAYPATTTFSVSATGVIQYD